MNHTTHTALPGAERRRYLSREECKEGEWRHSCRWLDLEVERASGGVGCAWPGSRADLWKLCPSAARRSRRVPAPTGNLYAYLILPHVRFSRRPYFLCGYTPYTHTDVYRESETERDRSGACGVFSVCWFWGDALSHGAILRSGMALGEHRPSLSASSCPLEFPQLARILLSRKKKDKFQITRFLRFASQITRPTIFSCLPCLARFP